MRIKGPRQSILGLFGGPFFLSLLVITVLLAGGIAYLSATGHKPTGSGASLALPSASAPIAAKPAVTSSGDLTAMPAIPVAREINLPVAVEEDLAPDELLAKYPAGASDRLTIGPEDWPAWRRFGRPSTVPPEAYRLALVVTGLGPSRGTIVRLVTGTPPDVTLSFRADTPDLAGWVEAARAYGHEVLLDLEFAPDAGGGLVLRADEPERNLSRLDAAFAEATGGTGIAGVAVFGARRFLGDAAVLQPILDRLHKYGLAVVGLPITAPSVIAADAIITAAPDQSPDQTLAQAVALAKQRNAAVALISAEQALPLLNGWYRSVAERAEISLVPVTSLVED